MAFLGVKGAPLAVIEHAKRMLIYCPTAGGKLHCWYCSRCDKAPTCTAWRCRRQDVEFFMGSCEPYSLYVASKMGAVSGPAKDKP